MNAATYTLPPAAPSPGGPVGQATGVAEVILGEHARILRLFGSLDNIARRAEPTVAPLMLGQVWARLASMLERHTEAEEEICFPVLFGRGRHALALMEDAIADHHDVREAVGEARLLDAGSALWWRTVTDTRALCTEHFAGEERGLLAQVQNCLRPERSKTLARLWAVFVATRAEEPVNGP